MVSGATFGNINVNEVYKIYFFSCLTVINVINVIMSCDFKINVNDLITRPRNVTNDVELIFFVSETEWYRLV